MNVFNKPLKDVDFQDIQNLVANSVEESLFLDYKQILNLKDDSSKNDLVNDVTSFANTEGGCLIYGVEEQSGLPKEIKGIEINDFDQLKRQIQCLLNNRIEPPITNCDFKKIAEPNGKCIIVILIPQSWNAPHRITHRVSTFYFRQSGKNELMNVYQIRDSFLSKNFLVEKIKFFIKERIEQIARGEDPANIRSGPKIILHLVPLDSFGVGQNIDVLSFHDMPQKVPPLNYSESYSPRCFINLDGIVTTNLNKSDIFSYAQFFRNGVIEACDLQSFKSNKRIALKIGNDIKIAVEKYFATYESLNIGSSLCVSLTILDANGFQLDLQPDDYVDQNRELTKDRITFDIIQDNMSSHTNSVENILKPLFDLFFNLFGLKDNLFYDQNGKWKSVKR